MLNAIEIGPGYGVNGLGLVEIEPGYGVDGLGAYDDVTLVGATMGAYDDVTLVGAFGQDEKPFFKKPLFWGALAGLAATAASAYLLGKAMAFK